MSQNQTATWLVTYDIADPRRLTQVFKTLKKAGIPLQYSVFTVNASAIEIQKLMLQLSRIINTRQDDVRAYRLPENAWRATLGNSILPEGLWLP
jgi:CRISPR-associated protein Cas2